MKRYALTRRQRQRMLSIATAAICLIVVAPMVASAAAIAVGDGSSDTYQQPAEDFNGLLVAGLLGVGVVISAKEIRENMRPIAEKIKALRDKTFADDYEWAGEDEQEWKRLNDEYNDLERKAEMQERCEGFDARRAGATEIRDELRRQQPNDDDDLDPPEPREDKPASRDDHVRAVQAWFRNQFGGRASQAQRESWERSKKSGHVRQQNGQLVIRMSPERQFNQQRAAMAYRNGAADELVARALTVGTANSGAELVPEGFVPEFERAMLAHGPMLQVAGMIPTQQGNDLPYPTVNDTSNEGAVLGEGTTIGASVDPATAAITFKAWKFSSKPILVNYELTEDDGTGLVNALFGLLGERIGRAANRQCTEGDGTTEPQGFLVGGAVGVTANSATAIVADELIDLEHSVDSAYRDGAAYQMHDLILSYVRKLKDGDNRYLYQFNGAQGVPDTINGKRFLINNHMPSTVATTNKTIGFGNWERGYKIRMVQSIRLRRLVERYADTDQEAFIAFLRLDGRVLNAGVNPIKYLQQA